MFRFGGGGLLRPLMNEATTDIHVLSSYHFCPASSRLYIFVANRSNIGYYARRESRKRFTSSFTKAASDRKGKPVVRRGRKAMGPIVIARSDSDEAIS